MGFVFIDDLGIEEGGICGDMLIFFVDGYFEFGVILCWCFC